MTASQGMMLSERPSGSLTGLGGSGPSLGNYKGVMLCNRPFGGVAAAARDSVDAGVAAVAAGRFVTGVVKTEPGYAAPQRVKDIVVVRQAKKKTALSRHRRWLADLQKTKDALEQQYMEGVQRKEEASRRFAEREAKSRHISLGVTHTDDDDARDNEHHAAASDEEHIYDADAQPKAAVVAKLAAAAAVKATDDADIGLSSTSAISSSKKHRHGKAGRRSNKTVKPLWALTQTDAAAAEAQAEEDEVSELLAFTKDLDFDKYIHDAEVQSMIDQVKRRIQELEKQEQANVTDNDSPDRPEVDDASTIGDNNDDDLQDEALAKRIMRLTDANLKRISSHGDNKNNSADDDAVSDVMSLARTVMSEGGKSVRTVHSTKSLAAVVTRSQAKQLGCIDESEAANKMETAVNVKLILHKEDGGMRLGGKNTVSNLPYIHRNPAI
jgi:hypothetical protein